MSSCKRFAAFLKRSSEAVTCEGIRRFQLHLADTIVVFTTDNGAEVMTWPDGGSTPFRGEKATNWEDGYRVPMLEA
jgi:arylsulfatase A-like enzyme